MRNEKGRDAEVIVRRQWNDWRQATYRLSDLEGAHWGTLSGGVRVRTPQPFLHGYVQCDAMLEASWDIPAYTGTARTESRSAS